MNGTHLALIGLAAGIAFLPMVNARRLWMRLDLWHCRWALSGMDPSHPEWAHVRSRVIDLDLFLNHTSLKGNP